MKWLIELSTWGIAYMLGVSKSDSDGYAENHKYPVDFRDVNLAMNFVGGVDNFNPGKTAQRLALIYYWKGSSYYCLTTNYRC